MDRKQFRIIVSILAVVGFGIVRAALAGFLPLMAAEVISWFALFFVLFAWVFNPTGNQSPQYLLKSAGWALVVATGAYLLSALIRSVSGGAF